jgi:hypothetical protein
MIVQLSRGSFPKAKYNLVTMSQLIPISSLVLVKLRLNLKIWEIWERLNGIVKFLLNSRQI